MPIPSLDTIVIGCKDCGALFYGNSRVTAEGVLEIVEYAKEGHEIHCVDSEFFRINFKHCLCWHKQD